MDLGLSKIQQIYLLTDNMKGMGTVVYSDSDALQNHNNAMTPSRFMLRNIITYLLAVIICNLVLHKKISITCTSIYLKISWHTIRLEYWASVACWWRGFTESTCMFILGSVSFDNILINLLYKTWHSYSRRTENRIVSMKCHIQAYWNTISMHLFDNV